MVWRRGGIYVDRDCALLGLPMAGGRVLMCS
jgi:hypothetical protein